MYLIYGVVLLAIIACGARRCCRSNTGQQLEVGRGSATNNGAYVGEDVRNHLQEQLDVENGIAQTAADDVLMRGSTDNPHRDPCPPGGEYLQIESVDC